MSAEGREERMATLVAQSKKNADWREHSIIVKFLRNNFKDILKLAGAACVVWALLTFGWIMTVLIGILNGGS